MACLSFYSISTTTSVTLASVLGTSNSNSNSASSSLSIPTKTSPKPRLPRSRNPTLTTPIPQPSLAEIEKAIGAGAFSDGDSRGSGEKPSLFDALSSSPIGQPEGAVEKKLRETGEWIIDTTEGDSRSSGHNILMVVCLGILPVWLLCLAVASGLLKLPFSIPSLDDLIM